MTGQIRNLGIGNLAGYTNLSQNQRNIIFKAYDGFDNEIEYTVFIHEIISMNLGIEERIYKNVLLKPQFYYFFLKTNPDFDNEELKQQIKQFVVLQFCQYLVNLFNKSLEQFSKRAMEFDIYEFEKKMLKGQIGKIKSD
jgi:hypothetical protein